MLKKEKDFFNPLPPQVVRKQLDDSKIENKLKGMKSVVAMMSKGEDVEGYFPDVVKNVITKNISLKKLIYLYLLHYAEKRPQEALLSVNNFKKDLNDKNQFIRALALRVMSGIKVDLIVEIVLSSVKVCVADRSPYVRKAAAIAIPKIFSQDPSFKDQLIDILDLLLADKHTMVLGAACFCFNELCPHNFGLIHQHFRKLCRFVINCDEWGQSEIIKVLLRYGRAQFLSPFSKDSIKKKKFYESDEDDYMSDSDHEEDDMKDNFVTYELDDDHRLLLTCVSPLIRTQNTGIVLQVISVFFHLAPVSEFENLVPTIVSLVSMSSFEDQYTILKNIRTMVETRRSLFTPFMKDFFIYFGDPFYLKKVKLDLLSSLSTEENVHMVLGEYKSYLKFPDQNFVAAVIPSIVKIAKRVKDITDSCIGGLMKLLSRPEEEIVSNAIVGIHQLIQSDPKKHKKIIYKLCTLLEGMVGENGANEEDGATEQTSKDKENDVHISSSEAKKVIVWMIGEYYVHVPSIGPDCLRILSKYFAVEKSLDVQLQILTLGTKLYLKLGSEVELLYKYVLNLAKYHPNYDVRERARFLRTLIFGNKTPNLSKHLEKILFRSDKQIMTEKLIKLLKKEEEEKKNATQKGDGVVTYDMKTFRLGSLTHLLGKRADGYLGLPVFPLEIDEEAKTLRGVNDETVIEEAEKTLNTDLEELGDDEDPLDFYDGEEEGEDGEWDGEEGDEYWGEDGEWDGEGDDFYGEEEGEYGEGEGEGEFYDGEEEGEYNEEDGEYYEGEGEGEGEYNEEDGEGYEDEEYVSDDEKDDKLISDFF